MMTGARLAQLVKRTREGSLEAFSWLYGEEFDSFYYFAYKMTGSEDSACEMTTGVMLRLYSGLGLVASATELREILAREAYRLCCGLIADSYPDESALRLDAIDPGNRALLLMHCHGHFTLRQIASIMSVSEDEAARRLALAGESLELRPPEYRPGSDEIWFPELSRSLRADFRELHSIRQKVRTWDMIISSLNSP